jgi:uncharacterized protein YuzE
MRTKAVRRLSSQSIRRRAAATKYSYDSESDVLLITLSKARPDFAEQSQNIITHYNKDGKPVEIEILDASQEAVNILKAILPRSGTAA